jgi:hypothetical protein
MKFIAESDSQYKPGSEQFGPFPSRGRLDRSPRQDAKDEVFEDVSRLSTDDVADRQLFGRQRGKKKPKHGNDNSRGSSAGESVGGENEDYGDPGEQSNPALSTV